MTRYRSNTLRSNMMDEITAALGINAKIQVRSGTPSGTAGGGTLLAELTGDGTAWAGAAVAGVLTSNGITADSSADATGTAGHYELLTSGSTWHESALLDTGGTDGVTIDNTSISAGQTVQMSGSWVNTAADDDQVA